MFEEDVDMELENEKRYSAPVLPAPVLPAPVLLAPELPATPELPTSSNIPPTTPMDVVTQTDNKAIDSLHPTAILSSTDVKLSSTEAEKENRPDKSSKLVPEKDGEPESNTVENTPEDKPSTPKVESFAAAMSSVNSADIGSRFYIKRRIIVGNVSKYMAPGKIF